MRDIMKQKANGMEYLETMEKAAQYPRLPSKTTEKVYNNREPNQYALMKKFMDH